MPEDRTPPAAITADAFLPSDEWIRRTAAGTAALCAEFLPLGTPVSAEDHAVTRRNLLDDAHLAVRVADHVSGVAVDAGLLPSGADVTAAYPAEPVRDPAYAAAVDAALAKAPVGAVLDQPRLAAVVAELAQAAEAHTRALARTSASALVPAAVAHANRPPPITLDRPLGKIVLIDEIQGRLTDEDLVVATRKLLAGTPISVAVAAEDRDRALGLQSMLNTYRVCPRDRIHAYSREDIADLPAAKRALILDGIASGKVDVIGRAADPAAAARESFAAPQRQAARGGDSR